MKRLRTALVLVMLGIGSTMAAAQSASARPDGAYVFGFGGRGGFGGADSDSPAFGGWLAGGGAGHALPHGWFVEGVVDQLVNYSSEDSGDKGDVTAIYGRIGHRWGPPSQAFRPYIGFAIGAAVDRWRDEYGEEWHGAGAIGGLILGGDFRAGNRFFVRPEVSALVGYWRASIGVGYRF